jgi:hypothetical protein
MKRWRGILTALAGVTGLALAAAAAVPEDSGDGPVTMTEVGKNSYTFTIKGKSVDKLYPGGTRYIKLTLINPYGYALKVTELKGTVDKSSRKKCKPDKNNVKVWAYTDTLPITVPKYSSKTVHSLPVAMPLGASAECADTTFTIGLTGSAKKVG